MARVVFTKQAIKDAEKLKTIPALWRNAQRLLDLLESDPLQTPPPYEKLSGDLNGAYSRRLNRQHRLVYQIRQETNEVVIIRMWTHYE